MKNDEKEIRRHAVPRVRILTTNFYTVHYNLQMLTSQLFLNLRVVRAMA